jgi:hypothetical protein
VRFHMSILWVARPNEQSSFNLLGEALSMALLGESQLDHYVGHF